MEKKIRFKFAATAVSAALLCTAAIGAIAANTAMADPVDDDGYSYTLVGSDTLEGAGNALANGEGARAATTNGSHVASFNAFGSSRIDISKDGGASGSIDRPGGSGAGITALADSITAGDGLVDVARSSRTPKTGTTGPNDAAHPLRWIPFGKDGVSVAVKGLGTVQLTETQLYNLYATSTPVVINGTTLNPMLPQSNSGTRAFFLQALGITTVGSQVLQNGVNHAGGVLQENDGSQLTQKGDVVPFSAAQWISQKNGKQYTPSTLLAGDEEIASILIGSEYQSPYTTQTDDTLAPNSAFYNSEFGRVTYLVVSQSQFESDDQFASLFDDGETSLSANPDADEFAGPTAQLKASYGFAPLITDADQQVWWSTLQG